MDEFVIINDFENYEINKNGVIRNVKTGHIMVYNNDKDGYKTVCIGKTTKRVHRLVALQFIENPNNKPLVDHIDRNVANNNVNNLRWATYVENQRNRPKKQGCTSNYKGVMWHKRDCVWQASITINGHQHHLGYYKNENDAGQSYNNYIIQHNLTEFFILNIV